MSKFGWDLPPGCTQRHIDEAMGGDDPCPCCGHRVDDCICPECKACGEVGNPECYDRNGDRGHGMEYTLHQFAGQARARIVMLQEQIDDEKMVLQELEEQIAEEKK